MTNADFQKKLEKIYASHDIIGKSEKKSINELSYMLRMTDEDYCLNVIDGKGDFICIPSVKEAFIPCHILAKKVKAIEYDEEIYELYGANLLIVLTEEE